MAVENAKIESTFLGREDHLIPSFMIQCEWGGGTQGFGGYDLRYSGHATLLFEIMDALGVASWEDLKGTYCRLRRDAGRIVAIGHIVDDRWVDMEARSDG